LLEELGMSGGTEKILPLVLLSPIERATVLQINPVLVLHPPFAMHLEIGRTEHSVFFNLERVFLTAARIKRNDRPGLHLRDYMLENVLGIVVSVPNNMRHRKLKLRRHLFEQGDSDFLFVVICRMSHLVNWKLSLGIINHVIAIAPEELDFTFERLGIVDFNTKPSVGITFKPPGFIEAIFDSGFEIILPHVGLNRRRIQCNDMTGDDFFIPQRTDKP